MSKKIFKLIGPVLWILLFGLSGYYMYTDIKQREVDTKNTIRIDSSVFIDTITFRDTIDIPKYVPKYTTINDTNWTYDTVTHDVFDIMQEYFNKNIYIDTIVNDSNITVIIIDTVCRNKIQSRHPFIVNNHKEITIDKKETIYLYPKNEFSIGGYAGLDKNAGFSALYKRNKNTFGGSIGSDGVKFYYFRKLSKK